jgi:hypothetical protein
MRTPKKVTHCTVCDRWVGVSPNWNVRQARQPRSDEWRVARHRRDPLPDGGRRGPRRPDLICGGSGVLVPPTVVFDNTPAKAVTA